MPMKKTQFILTILCSALHLFAQPNNPKLTITHLTGDYYIYTTHNTYEGYKIPAHGLYLVTDSGVVLIDTPWDTTQFQPLLDSIRFKHGKEVVMCIATHWHSDRTDGLEYYKQKGIKTYTTKLTDELCKKNDKRRAEVVIENDTTFHIGQYTFETYYPGWGHTEDNIVVWFHNERILYGGCLIKGAESRDLGNLEDANVDEYVSTLKRVQRKYPHAKYILVSHHDWRSRKSLGHSLKLARKLTRERKK